MTEEQHPFLDNMAIIYRQASKSGDQARCLVAPSLDLQNRIKQELAQLRSQASGHLANDGSEISISYTAYPPSPAQQTRRIRLRFHAGTILIGDYLKACGRYDPSTRIIVVAEPGDYIETYPQKS